MAYEGLTALREGSQLSVEISELLGKPGTSKRLEFSEEIHGLGLDLGRVEPLLGFDLRLDSLVEGVLVSGQVRGAYSFECIRCVRPFSEPFSVEVSEVLAYEGHEGAEEGYQITADHAHLEPLVRDAVLLAMPLHPLCRPDCKGLCPVCGSDLNSVDCGHKVERTDLRWEPLAQLRERFKE
jgi:DUF177 domain-containing protein